MTDSPDADAKRFNRNLRRRISRARRFPYNTDPYLRHVQMMAECLAKDKPYGMFEDERLHCAGSLLAVVYSLLADPDYHTPAGAHACYGSRLVTAGNAARTHMGAARVQHMPIL